MCKSVFFLASDPPHPWGGSATRSTPLRGGGGGGERRLGPVIPVRDQPCSLFGCACCCLRNSLDRNHHVTHPRVAARGVGDATSGGGGGAPHQAHWGFISRAQQGWKSTALG